MKLSAVGHRRLVISMIVLMVVIPVGAIIMLGLMFGGVFDEKSVSPGDICPVPVRTTQPPPSTLYPSIPVWQPAETPAYCG